ncbi:tyrosine-type recombinase/integrase [Sporosarcina newyorkensis]|uniref:tyrosine-type recombinase/integrase n=1 Tax=Sporosarcina newyorkensis TaxID=759851 RepID=UPI003CFE6FCC
MMDHEATINKFFTDNQFRLEEESLETYCCAVRQFLDYTGKPLMDINKTEIRDWLSHLKEKDYKPWTIWSKLTGLRTFFKYCVEESLTDINPAAQIPYPRVGEKLPYYLTKEQLNKLRMHLEGRLQERAIVEILYATGVRISELCAMKKEDIDWSERTIHIPSGKWKKSRIVLFTQQSAAHLQAYLESRTDDLPYVFLSLRNKDRAINPCTIGQWLFRNYSKSLGFKVTPHTIRHTFAAHLIQKGMPLNCIQVLLGHVEPQQTQYYARLYNHARKEKYDEFM